MPEIYTSEHLVVITSEYENTAREWRMYLTQRWNSLVRENSRILILAGVHGNEDGKVGANDFGLLEDNTKQIPILKRKFAQDVNSKNVRIDLVNVASYQNPEQMDSQKLVQAIKNYNPTILILSFCYSKISELNDILRYSGIYSVLIMRRAGMLYWMKDKER